MFQTTNQYKMSIFPIVVATCCHRFYDKIECGDPKVIDHSAFPKSLIISGDVVKGTSLNNMQKRG